MTIRLGDAESRVLEGFCRRQVAWDPDLPARVVSASRALGVFTTPPLGVMVFAAVPTTDPVEPSDVIDAIVSLADLADALHAGRPDGPDLAGLPGSIVPAGQVPTLLHLPPTDGWQVPIGAVAGDLIPLIDRATAEFEARTAGLSPHAQATIADEIWERPAFGGLPVRAVHAARQLGMITTDSARVSAATCGPWKRLSTQRGQVFVYANGPAARLALHVVR